MEHPIQIAGIIDEKEARLVLNCGATELGFPLRLPIHRPDLSEDDARRIIASLDLRSRATLITYLSRAEEVCQLASFLGVLNVQLHGDILLEELKLLHGREPRLTVIKSLVVKENNTDDLVHMIDDASLLVDMFITDTFDPSTGASGATGKIHDWNVSRLLVQRSPKPVILAGGLTPDNVHDAILYVRPAGVDSHSGVENACGRKDPNLVKRFVSEAIRGFAEIDP